MTSSSVAVLVDGDNISSSMAGQILRKTAELRTHRMRFAYCNTQSVGDWASAASFRVIHANSGRNGSDILLSIHAMKFALRDNIETFVIASSDSDLSHIAHGLREVGRHVVGVGEEKAPKAFRLACEVFMQLNPPTAKIAETTLGPIDRAIRNVLVRQDPNRQGVPVARLNGLVRAEDNTIKISERPEKTWPKYLMARTDLYAVVGEGTNRRVRIAAVSEDS